MSVSVHSMTLIKEDRLPLDHGGTTAAGAPTGVIYQGSTPTNTACVSMYVGTRTAPVSKYATDQPCLHDVTPCGSSGYG